MALRSELGGYLPHQKTGHPDLFNTADQGKHDLEPTDRKLTRSQQQCPQLGAEKVWLREAQADAAQPKDRVGLGAAPDDLASQLAAPEVEGADDHRVGCHLQHHLSIDLDVILFRGQRRAHFHIEKLGPIEPDARDVPVHRVVNFVWQIDVGQ